MSHRSVVSIIVTAALLSSCQGGGSPTTPVTPIAQTGITPQPVVASLGALAQHEGYIESALGLYSLSIDPAAGSATTDLLATRSLQDNDDVYELSITNFLRRDSFTIAGVTRTATTLDVHYSFEHPFPAPSDPTGTPNVSTNRADLGVAGRLLVLADVVSPTGNTYFSDVILNTSLLTNPDAYYQPAGLLNQTASANAFPYKVLVNESGPDGNRGNGITNAGDPTGNYGTDGWTRAEFGTGNDAWTGYGVLHQGQVSTDTLSFDLTALSTGLDLTIAVLVKYNDPRGGTNSVEKRGNRLPPATPDHTKFAYRMPHGALDVERISFEGESGGFEPNVSSSSTLRFRVVDWDARATETGLPNLFEDGNLNAVSAGERGAPSLEACIPGVLGDATVVEPFAPTDLLDDDSAIGGDIGLDSGRPDDALFFERLVTKPVGVAQTAGNFTGLVRAIDPEPQGLVVALDGTTLAPLSTNLPEAITYQDFEVAMSGTANLPPEIAGTIGLKLKNPCLPTPATFVIENRDLTFSDPESDPITFTVVGTPDVGTPVTVSDIADFPISNAATGPWTNPSTTQVTFDVYANDPAHSGTTGTPLPAIYAPQPLVGRVSIPAPWVDVYGGGSAIVYDQTIAPNGDLYVAGYYTGTADLNPGAGVDSHPSAGNWDCYVLRFDPSGNFVWARHMGGPAYDYVDALAVDGAGNVYCSGRFEESFDFDPGAGVEIRAANGPVGDIDGFIWSLDQDGNFRWASVFGTTGTDSTAADWPFDIALDPGGNPTAVGRSDGLADFDPGPGDQSPPVVGGSDSFLLTLNAADGSFARVLRMGSTSADNFSDIAYDSAGGLFLSGAFNSTMDFDSGPGVQERTSALGASTYILKLNASDLAFNWVAHLETQIPQGQTYYGLAVDTAGDVYLSATYADGGTGDMDAGPGTALLPPVAGVWDAFLVAYTANGNYKWHTVAGGPDVDWGHTVVVIDRTVFWGGGFTGSAVDFDPSSEAFALDSAGRLDAFIAAYESQYGFFEGAASFGSSDFDEVYQLSQANLCDPILGGWTQGTVDYDPGPGTQTKSPTGSFSAYLLKLNGGTLAF